MEQQAKKLTINNNVVYCDKEDAHFDNLSLKVQEAAISELCEAVDAASA